jgi:cystathionine beta-synthase
MRENQLLPGDRATLEHVMAAKGTAPRVVSTAPGAIVRQAIGLMQQHDVSQLPVMDGETCVGSVTDWSLTTRSLDDPKMLDATVSSVMDAPFPIVDSTYAVDAVSKLLSKTSPAVLVRENGRVRAIVTRSDMLMFMMAR